MSFQFFHMNIDYFLFIYRHVQFNTADKKTESRFFIVHPFSQKSKNTLFFWNRLYIVRNQIFLHLNLYRVLEVCKSDFGVGTIGFRKRECFRFFCNRLYYEKSVLSLFICYKTFSTYLYYQKLRIELEKLNSYWLEFKIE